jgi:hypothetical protein
MSFRLTPLCGAVRRHNRQDFLTTSSKLMEISQRDIKRVSCNQIFGLYYKVYSFLVSCFLKSPASSGGFPGRFMPPFPRRARRTRQYQLHPHVLVSPFPESTVFYNSLYPLPLEPPFFSLGKTRTLEPPKLTRDDLQCQRVFAATKRCNCSMNRNMRIVLGLQVSAKIGQSGRIQLTPVSTMLVSIPSSGILAPHSLTSSRIFSRVPFPCQLDANSFGFLHTGASPPAEAALCNLLFRTSAGAQTVVATVPAANEAAIWTGTPSETLSILLDRICLFADVYLMPVSLYQ